MTLGLSGMVTCPLYAQSQLDAEVLRYCHGNIRHVNEILFVMALFRKIIWNLIGSGYKIYSVQVSKIYIGKSQFDSVGLAYLKVTLKGIDCRASEYRYGDHIRATYFRPDTKFPKFVILSGLPSGIKPRITRHNATQNTSIIIHSPNHHYLPHFPSSENLSRYSNCVRSCLLTMFQQLPHMVL